MSIIHSHTNTTMAKQIDQNSYELASEVPKIRAALKVLYKSTTSRISIKKDNAVETKRKERIEEAINFESGANQAQKVFTQVWTDGEYEVLLGKPGKETGEYGGPRSKNPGAVKNINDMLPEVRRHGIKVGNNASFDDINNALWDIHE